MGGGAAGEAEGMLTFYLGAVPLPSNVGFGDVRVPRGGVPEMRAGSAFQKKKRKKVGDGGRESLAPLCAMSQSEETLFLPEKIPL